MRSLLIAGALLGAMGCNQAVEATTTARPQGPSAGTPVSTARAALAPFRPVVGGQLTLSADRRRVALADAEGDVLRVYDLTQNTLAFEVELPLHAWPTRALEGENGDWFVLLRGLGALATVTPDPVAPGRFTVSQLAVCPEPRALALNPEHQLLVACAGGELVRVAQGQVLETTATSVEWRDLAITGGVITGTSFRSAQRFTIATPGAAPVGQRAPPQRLVTNPLDVTLHEPQVAWRTVPGPGGTSFMVHQLHADLLRVDTAVPGAPDAGPVGTSNSPYGTSRPPPIPGQPPVCSSSAVVTGITTFGPGGLITVHETNDVLPVDAALSPDGAQLAVAGAGGTGLSVYPTAMLSQSAPCVAPAGGVAGMSFTSVAWVSNSMVVVLETLHRTPLLLDLNTGRMRSLGNDTGHASAAHALFHEAPRGGAALACASCHPEGGEDGHLWIIDGKPRRTQTLSGGVMARAPFHWKGDLPTLDGLMSDTFVRRMGAVPVSGTEVRALASWLDTLPAPAASRVLSPEQRAAGLALFQKARCAACHLEGGTIEGPLADVGTGEALRSPNLRGLHARAPYLHTGALFDIRSRVMGPADTRHGDLAALTDSEKETLVAYLESL